MNVNLRGEGVAAACCAALLAKASIPPTIERVSRPPPPVVMLSDQALALVRDVLDRPALWADAPRIDRRVVAWGSSDPVAIPHAAAILSGSAIEAAMDDFLVVDPARPASDFTIHAAPPFPFGDFRRFGERRATATPVRLLRDEDRSACWIEAVADGWLFLIPTSEGEGWLLAVGEASDDLLVESRLIAPRIAPLDQPGSAFHTSPGMLCPPRTASALACGSAALAFDPLCGDGTSQAAREAILASAVVVGISEGGDAEALQAHYEAMVTAAMRRHLLMCMDFYRSGGDGPWWQEQLASLTEGHAWCTERLGRMPEPRFLLNNDRLVPREVAA
jgi:hypothetical protein